MVSIEQPTTFAVHNETYIAAAGTSRTLLQQQDEGAVVPGNQRSADRFRLGNKPMSLQLPECTLGSTIEVFQKIYSKIACFSCFTRGASFVYKHNGFCGHSYATRLSTCRVVQGRAAVAGHGGGRGRGGPVHPAAAARAVGQRALRRGRERARRRARRLPPRVLSEQATMPVGCGDVCRMY